MNNISRQAVTCLAILCTAAISSFAQQKPVVSHGVLDLRQWDLSKHKVALTGHWIFFDSQLVENGSTPGGSLVYFPEVLTNTKFESTMFGTYALTILLPAQRNDSLMLEVPQLYSSYRLLVNDELVAENGVPGTTRATTKPQWKPLIAALDSVPDTLRVTLQVANFYHDQTGGKQPIYLGTAHMLQKHHNISLRSNLAEFLVLLVLGFSFLIVYYVQQEKKKITLFFSLLCLSWATRSVFSNNYLVIDYFPDFDWTWMVRIEYITLFSMLIFAALFFSRLFEKESNRVIEYLLVGVNVVFIIETLVMSPAYFTKWLLVYLIVATLLLVHNSVIAIRALLNARAGVWYLIFSLILGLMLFTYDIFVFEGYFQYYDAILFSIGYSVIFLLLAVSLFYHLKIFKGDSTSETMTFDDLYKTR